MYLELLGTIFFVGLVYACWKFRTLDADWSSFHSNIKPNYFDKKIIWITGASSGIGKALALKIASFSDCIFILTARRESVLEEVGKEIMAINKNSQFVSFPMDMSKTDLSYYQSMTEQLKKKFPNGVDILVHSAGYTMRSCALDFPLENDLDLIQVDLISPILLTKLMLPEMTIKNEGKKSKDIVILSSMAGLLLSPVRTTYGCCKAGIAGFHECLRYEVLPYNVHILNVFPGPVATNIDVNSVNKQGQLLKQKEDFIQQGLPVQRCAELICASISAHLPECWPCKPPPLYVQYAITYLPCFKRLLMPIVAKKLLTEHGY